MDRSGKVIGVMLTIIALGMAIYQLAYTQVLLQDPDAHLITHLGFALVITFLSLMRKEPDRKKWWLAAVLLLLSLGVTAYLLIELDDILTYRTSIPATSDLVVGILIVIILMVGNWMVFGKTFTIVSLIAVAYLIFGRYLPAPFTVPSISFVRVLMWISVELGSGKGVYGTILDMSAIYLFLFIFFGGVLYAFGGTRFIIGLGRWLGSKLRAGPAMVALFSSSFLGTVTGSTVANITITGAFTIPMMKKSGYSPEQAGAIETVSSNGGQITPPIMGATAFLIAGFADIPYIAIVKAAIIPALLYMLCVFFYISLTAKKMNIRAQIEFVEGKQLLLDAPIFILPLGVLVVLLIKGFTLPFVGFWSIITLVSVGLITTILRKDLQINIKEMIDNLVASICSACGIALICALLGVVVSAIVSSGLAVKLPLAIEDLSGGMVVLALFLTMLSSMILGIGVPTPAAYMLVAIGAVPTLIRLDVPVLPAHLFCFVSAISSHITPPIAIGALVASQIAGANYWKTAWEAVKAAFAKYLLPFLFIYAPITILQPDAGFLTSALQSAAILSLIFSLQIGVSRYCFTPLKWNESFAFLAAALFSLIAIFTRNEYFFSIGLILFAGSIIRQFMVRRKIRPLNGGSAAREPLR
jgi:TRAP transporter 4TM/12TM fusion protein